MIGAIIGDIAGSRFEFKNHKNKQFELFTEDCRITDDSIMTLAIAKAVIETEKSIQPSIADDRYNERGYVSLLVDMAVQYMQQLGRKYPDCGFGSMFAEWVFSEDPEPYNSFGNGAAMRVSPIGFLASTKWEAANLSEAVTEITHDHKEGLKGAEAISVAVYMARKGYAKHEIRREIHEYYYPLDFKIEEVKASYAFDVTCQGTVPYAIAAFLESVSFEDAIRTAISIGGDSDTIASITGAIAEAYYGVPEVLKVKALSYLDNDLRAIYTEWCNFYKGMSVPGKFKVLTKFIGKIQEADSIGEWFVDRENDGTPEHPRHMPFVHYNQLIDAFVEEFYQFSESHPEYELTRYGSILEENGLRWDRESMQNADASALDEQCILALIMGAIRAERFSEGALLAFFEEGHISDWLKRLYTIDSSNKETGIQEIHFEIGGFGERDTYHILTEESGEVIQRAAKGYGLVSEKRYTKEEAVHMFNEFKKIDKEFWRCSYLDPYVCDGTQWRLAVRYEDGRIAEWGGSNAYPPDWNKVLSFFGIDYDEE